MKMKFVKKFKYAALAFLVIIFEQSFAKYLVIGGAVPMLSFCFCVLFGMFEQEADYVLTVSAIMGMVFDLLTGHGFGTYTVGFCFAAYLSFEFRDRIFSSKVLFLIIDVFFTTIITLSIYLLFHIRALDGRVGNTVISVILPTTVYNIAVCLLFYRPAKRVFEKRR